MINYKGYTIILTNYGWLVEEIKMLFATDEEAINYIEENY